MVTTNIQTVMIAMSELVFHLALALAVRNQISTAMLVIHQTLVYQPTMATHHR
jgi:hypothetical protein